MSDYQWMTTAPNPRVRSQSADCGQRGWRLHAIKATEKETFVAVKHRRALCGLRAAHGWSLDLFIEKKCRKCEKALLEIPAELTPAEERAEAEEQWKTEEDWQDEADADD